MYSLDDYNKYLINVYDPLEFIPTHGNGSYLYDGHGKDVIDFASGIAVTSLGHTNPILIDSLIKQAHTLWHTSNIIANYPQIELAKKLVNSTCFDKAFFCNSGAEAVEACLKLARRYAYKNYDNKKHNIVSFEQSFHGRTLFTVTAGGQAKYREGFEPVVGGVNHGIFNDIESARKLINDNTAAVIVELIQAEGGVTVAQIDFIAELRKLCDKFNSLLIFDEVQTGMGRTGKLFAYMHYPVTPDIIAVAKALGGGFPIGAILVKEPYQTGFDIGSHGTTFGGNPLACAVANTCFDLINQPATFAAVEERAKLFVNRLNDINNDLNIYSQICGKGLLIGARLHHQYLGKSRDIVKLAIKHNVLVLTATLDVNRFLPALNIPLEDITIGLDRFQAALTQFKQEMVL